MPRPGWFRTFLPFARSLTLSNSGAEKRRPKHARRSAHQQKVLLVAAVGREPLCALRKLPSSFS